MALLKKKKRKIKYRFADDVLAKDTVISLIMGILAAVAIIISVVLAVAKLGRAGEEVGLLLLSSIVMSVTGLIFGIISLHTVEGGTNSKHISIMICLIDLSLIVLFYCFSRI